MTRAPNPRTPLCPGSFRIVFVHITRIFVGCLTSAFSSSQGIFRRMSNAVQPQIKLTSISMPTHRQIERRCSSRDSCSLPGRFSLNGFIVNFAFCHLRRQSRFFESEGNNAVDFFFFFSESFALPLINFAGTGGKGSGGTTIGSIVPRGFKSG